MSTASNNDVNSSALLTGVAATTSQSSPDQVNAYGRGVKVYFNISSIGTGSVTLTIQGKDPGSGTYYTILASAALIAGGFTSYTVYPGAPATANVSANDVLPRVWRVTVTANNANPVNYSVGACVIV